MMSSAFSSRVCIIQAQLHSSPQESLFQSKSLTIASLYGELQWVVVCCSVLQCVAVSFGMLQCVAVCYSDI